MAMSNSCSAWDKCVKLVASDRVLQDVLVRAARRRYEIVRRGLDHDRKDEAWSEAVREVVSAAFADDGVVRLLREKMKSCKETRSGKRIVSLAKTVGAGALAAPVSRCDEAQHIHKAVMDNESDSDEERSRCSVKHGEQSLHSGHDSQHSRELLGVESARGQEVVPTFAVDVHTPLLQQHLEQQHTDNCETGSTGVGGSGGRNNKPRMPASVLGGGEEKAVLEGGGGDVFVSSRADAHIICKGKSRASPSLVVGKNQPSLGIDSDIDVCKPGEVDDRCSDSKPTAMGKDSAPVPDEQSCPPVPHNLLSSWRTMTATAVDSATVNSANSIITASTSLLGRSEPRPLLGQRAENLSVKEGAESKATASVSLGVLPFEARSPDKGFALAQEARHDLAKQGTFFLAGDANIEGDTVTSATVNNSNTQTSLGTVPGNSSRAGAVIVDTAKLSPPTEGAEDARRGGVSIVTTASAMGAGSEREQAVETLTANAPAVFNLSGTVVVPRVQSPDNRLQVEQENYPLATEDEEYASDTFDRQKNVHFSDEALWTVHEIRPSFEQDELAELFCTVAEFDRMSEEAEQEEALGAQELQEGGGVVFQSRAPVDDNNPGEVDIDVVGVMEDISFESYSFDGENSDDNF